MKRASGHDFGAYVETYTSIQSQRRITAGNDRPFDCDRSFPSNRTAVKHIESDQLQARCCLPALQAKRSDVCWDDGSSNFNDALGVIVNKRSRSAADQTRAFVDKNSSDFELAIISAKERCCATQLKLARARNGGVADKRALHNNGPRHVERRPSADKVGSDIYARVVPHLARRVRVHTSERAWRAYDDGAEELNFTDSQMPRPGCDNDRAGNPQERGRTAEDACGVKADDVSANGQDRAVAD